MLIQWYKYSASISAILWIALGTLTIGSIVLSSIGWVINLVMGLLFILIGCFLYLRAYHWRRFYITVSSDMRNNPHLQRFLRLDLLFVLGACLLGALFLTAGVSRVFGEGYAIFG